MFSEFKLNIFYLIIASCCVYSVYIWCKTVLDYGLNYDSGSQPVLINLNI